MPDKVPCIRCGVCCVNAPCGAWDSESESEIGLCPALIIHEEGHTSCKHIMKEGNPFGEGCVIRGFDEGFVIMKRFAEEKAGVALPGIEGGA